MTIQLMCVFLFIIGIIVGYIAGYHMGTKQTVLIDSDSDSSKSFEEIEQPDIVTDVVEISKDELTEITDDNYIEIYNKLRTWHYKLIIINHNNYENLINVLVLVEDTDIYINSDILQGLSCNREYTNLPYKYQYLVCIGGNIDLRDVSITHIKFIE